MYSGLGPHVFGGQGEAVDGVSEGAPNFLARYSSTAYWSPAYDRPFAVSGVISTGTVTLPRSATPSPSAYEKRPMSGSLLSPPDKIHSG